jgi:hypothetical protein
MSTTDHIFCIHQILEKKWEHNEAVHQLFIDFKKAYDSVRKEALYNILIEFRIPKKLVRLIQMCLIETYSVKIDNSSIERVEEFKYLGTKITHQNSIQEEIKSRLKLGNACYHSVQNLLSSRLLSKNLKIKIYKTIILPVIL